MDIARITSKKSFLLGLLGLILVLLATLPLYASGYTPILMTSIFMYIILSVSWTLFSGPTGYMSLATAAFFGVGIYTAAVLGKRVTPACLYCCWWSSQFHSCPPCWRLDPEAEGHIFCYLHLRTRYAHRAASRVLGASCNRHTWPICCHR